MIDEVKTIFIEHAPYGPEVYLGDGLYASSNGDMIKLRAPRFGEDHEVFLERAVLQNFQDFVNQLRIER